jgi:tetratricopeptide (TPR) repeat protein
MRLRLAERALLLIALCAPALAGMTTPTLPQQRPDAAACDSLRLLVDRALVTSRLPDYDKALAFIDQERARHPNDAVMLHYRGFMLYRKASFLAATGGDTKVARSMFEEAERALEQSEATVHWPESIALRSAVVGQLIGLSGPLGGMRLGPKSMRLLDEAVAAGPENPRVWMLRGVSDFRKPRLLGGSAEKAEADLLRAVTLFEKDAPEPPAPWWGRAEAYGWLGQVYAKQGKMEAAKAAYAKALDLEPGNAWVMELLLPAVRGERR